MPKKTFKLVYYETNTLARKVEATSLKAALKKADKIEGWEDCEEESLGTGGVEEAFDESGQLIYSTRDCTCDEESYYGPGHSTSCPRFGLDKGTTRLNRTEEEGWKA